MAADNSSEDAYRQLDPTLKQSIICYRASKTTSSGIWTGDNPLNYSFPLLLYQLVIVFIATRVVHSVLHRLSFPKVITQMIAGMLLGPTFAGRSMNFEKLLFSLKSWEHLNTISLLSYLIFLFLIGVKTDLGMVRKAGKKAVALALVGTLLSFFLFIFVAWSLRHYIPPPLRDRNMFITINFKWCLTCYTVLACTLSELHLLTSKLGKLAMSASLIADFANLVIGAGLIAYVIGDRKKDIVLSGTAFLAFAAFMAFVVLVARPVTVWIIRRTPEGSLLDEASFVAVIFIMLLCGLLSETIGLHVTTGPLFYGLVLPGGAPLGVTLVERTERLVAGLFMPLFVAQAGLRMDLGGLKFDVSTWGFIALLVAASTVGKFLGVMAVCIYCRMPTRDAVSLSLIMINKGILEIDNASYWLDAKMVTHQVYTVLMLSVILFGGLTTPLIKLIYRPEDRFIAYKRRTVQHTKPNAELRILACLYHQENVNSILALLESSHPAPDSPICIYVLHLSHLAGRAAAVLAPYKRSKNSNLVTETDHIVNAFNYFAQQNQEGCVTIIPYISMSPYNTMHDDICSLALEKKAAMVLVPFHKHVAIDGTIESINPSIQNVNVNVLHYCPCSVGILVFQGGRTVTTLSTQDQALGRVAVYFIGGPDDREALAYGMRMAEDTSIGLTVVRFRPPKEMREGLKEEKLDDSMVEEFQMGQVDGARVVYREETVIDGEGTVGVIRAMSSHFSLLIVGRREGMESNLTEGLSVWNEYPELGIVGDLLASTDFGGRVSTLVVQQQRRFGAGGGSESPKVLQHKGQIVPTIDFDD